MVIKKWQNYFKIYFSSCNNNLEYCENELNRGIYILSVTLNDTWRRIAVPGDCKLKDMCEFVIDVFDFDSQNLYAIEVNNSFGITKSYSSKFTEPPYVDDFKTGEV